MNIDERNVKIILAANPLNLILELLMGINNKAG